MPPLSGPPMLRRKRYRVPTPPSPEGGDEARRAVATAVRRLGDAMSRQRAVDEVSNTLREVERENHLVPKISAALGAHSE